MPVITAAKPQEKQKRVNIYLDNKFGFGLDLENYLKLSLKVGQELSEKEIEEIVKKSEFQKTLAKLLKYSTLRPRSKKEINDWLRKKKVHISLHSKLFNRLKRLELIDDKKFANWWIDQRISFRPRGKRALTSELRQKGVENQVINEALAETKINEEKIAVELIRKNLYKWKGYKGFEKRKKIGDFLARKGFNWTIIKEVVKDFLD